MLRAVSKSSFFLLLLTVASLSAVASHQSGGARWGNSSASLTYEATAGITSLHDEMVEIWDQAGQLPRRIRDLLDDLRKDITYIGSDARVDARLAARYLTGLVKTS